MNDFNSRHIRLDDIVSCPADRLYDGVVIGFSTSATHTPHTLVMVEWPNGKQYYHTKRALRLEWEKMK